MRPFIIALAVILAGCASEPRQAREPVTGCNVINRCTVLTGKELEREKERARNLPPPPSRTSR